MTKTFVGNNQNVFGRWPKKNLDGDEKISIA